MTTTRWVVPKGVRLCLFEKGKTYQVSRHCGHYLIAYGYAHQAKIKTKPTPEI